MGEGVTRAVGGDSGTHRLADEGEIADEIEEFVERTFVGMAEGVVDWSGVGEHEHVAGIKVRKQADGLHCVGFVLKAEGARGGDEFDVGRGVVEPMDGGVGDAGLGVVDGVGVGGALGGFDPDEGVFVVGVLDGDGFGDGDRFDGFGELIEPGVDDRVDKVIGGAIEDGDLGVRSVGIDLDDEVGDV